MESIAEPMQGWCGSLLLRDRLDRPGSIGVRRPLIGAATVAGGDMRVADDVGAEDLAEQRELRLARLVVSLATS